MVFIQSRKVLQSYDQINVEMIDIYTIKQQLAVMLTFASTEYRCIYQIPVHFIVIKFSKIYHNKK